MSQNLLAVLGTGLVDPSQPILRGDDAGVTRGDGCFEGIRLRTDRDGRTTADKLDRHLARMTRSATALDIAFDEPAWRELIDVGCAGWDGAPGSEAALKLVLTRGPAGSQTPSGFLTITPLPSDYPRQRREGIAVITLSRGLTSEAFRATPWLLGGVKTLSYAVNMAAQREAERRGAIDAILVSAEGLVLEAPTGSVVWSVGRQLWTTPTGDTGILAGTTQQLLFDQAAAAGWATGERLVDLAELHAAEALWIVSSVRGPVEVIDLDGHARERVPAVDAEIKALSGF